MKQLDNLSIYDLAMIRSFMDFTEQENYLETDPIMIPMNDVVDYWIQYFWPLFDREFIALKKFETIEKPKISFRNNLSHLIDFFQAMAINKSGEIKNIEPEHKEFSRCMSNQSKNHAIISFLYPSENSKIALDLFRNKLSLTRNHRIIDVNLGNKIQTLVNSMEKTILTSSIKNFKDINGQSVFHYDPKRHAIRMELRKYKWIISELIKSEIHEESNQTTMFRLWTILIQKLNPNL